MDSQRIDLLETAVATASPAELTLLLYDGAIRFANQAIEKLETEQFDNAGEDIVRVGNIIHEFQATLDYQYPISEAFNDLYQYMFRRLCVATVDESASRKIVLEVRDMLREFRDTWKKAMDLAVA